MVADARGLARCVLGAVAVGGCRRRGRVDCARGRAANGSWAVLRSARVWNLGIAYFGLKLIRYSILFWLPLYLHRELGYSEGGAGYQSLSFLVGGTAGAVLAGALSDRWRARRGPV